MNTNRKYSTIYDNINIKKYNTKNLIEHTYIKKIPKIKTIKYNPKKKYKTKIRKKTKQIAISGCNKKIVLKAVCYIFILLSLMLFQMFLSGEVTKSGTKLQELKKELNFLKLDTEELEENYLKASEFQNIKKEIEKQGFINGDTIY